MSTITLNLRPLPTRTTIVTATPRTGSAHTPASRRRWRLTSRGRAVLLTLIALPIVCWLLMAQLDGGAATGTLEGGSVPIVMVAPGESLWSVAERVAHARQIALTLRQDGTCLGIAS